ncbi:hypothetical protein [Allofrancisella frigidaquae]|uniref:Uncharacterized protein n=1 Tax=Allofrancisella frigidaquae TaxID=1085644 RepID=A0A6M3HRZ1_9GAMM|nr:hypothetical protein [Allofrancisella frigidaquae]QIV93897.1 hypothetical protein E3E15_00400 [Allofrancisella frigidaquae]
MSIIKGKEKRVEKENKVALNFEIDECVAAEIIEYLKWADIKDKNYFLEEACKYLFQVDKNWDKFKKNHFESTGAELIEKKETDVDIKNLMVGEDEGMLNLEEEKNLGRKLQKKKT